MKTLKTIYQNISDMILSKILLISVQSDYYATHAFATKRNGIVYEVFAGMSNKDDFPYIVATRNSLNYQNIIKCEDVLDLSSQFHFEVARIQKMLENNEEENKDTR
jgi:hypothetical protein